MLEIPGFTGESALESCKNSELDKLVTESFVSVGLAPSCSTGTASDVNSFAIKHKTITFNNRSTYANHTSQSMFISRHTVSSYIEKISYSFCRKTMQNAMN